MSRPPDRTTPARADGADGSTAPAVDLGALTDAFVTVNAEWQITYFNRQTEADPAAADGDVADRNFWTVFPSFAGTTFEDRCRAAMDERAPVWFTTRVDSDDWFEVRVYPSDAGLAVSVQDVTENRRRQVRLRRNSAELSRRRAELETLNRVNEVIREVNQALVAATTREGIARAVCDRLTASNLYEAALFAKRGVGDRPLTAVTTAGADEEYLSIVASLDAETIGSSPGGRAFASGEVRVAESVATDPTFPDETREAALERGYRSAAAVPIAYEPNVYGVLLVYANRQNAFDDREQQVLSELGETIGDALNAADARRLLFTDTVVEVELAVTDPTEFGVAAVGAAGGRLRLQRVVPVSEDRYLHYLTFEDAASTDLIEAVSESPTVREVRAVGDDGQLLEVITVSDAAAARLVASGARVRGGIVEGGEAHLIVEVAIDADVRALVESLRAVVSGVRLDAKRAVDRPIATVEEFRQTLSGDLSARQRAALEMAHASGYYEWPRRCSGGDLAESMGVSSPTFHQHLRTAEHKLLRVFLGDDG